MEAAYSAGLAMMKQQIRLGMRRAWTVLALFIVGCFAIYAPSSVDEPPAYCTAFNHLVKSGGSSIKSHLAISSRKDGSIAPGVCILRDARHEELCADAVHNTSVITGYTELLRKPLENLGRECEYFTMMRHPIHRLISAFYYCPAAGDVQRRPRKYCGDPEERGENVRTNLLAFARAVWKNKTYMQMMYSIFCVPNFKYCQLDDKWNGKIRPFNLDGSESWDILFEIQEILSTYVAVGISEEWDLSMRLFDAKVTSPVKDWYDHHLHVNLGVSSQAREELLQWALISSEIRRALSADLLIYEFAVELFRQQTHEALGVNWEGGTLILRAPAPE